MVTTNNCSNNLEWVDIPENVRRACNNGLFEKKTYNEELIHFICSKLQDGYGVIDIYRMLESNNAKAKDNFPLYMLISRLRNREEWDNITEKYNYTLESTSRKGQCQQITVSDDGLYSEETIRKICEMLQNGYNMMQIFNTFYPNKSRQEESGFYNTIVDIRLRRRWKYISNDYTWDLKITSSRQSLVQDNIYEMFVNGLSKKEVRNHFSLIHKKDNPPLWERINRIYSEYNHIKSMSKNDTIIIRD